MNFSTDSAEVIGKTVADLVAIKSLSGEEAPVADYIQTFLQKAKLNVTRDDQDNLQAVIEPLTPGNPKETTLHLSGHTDTVVPVEGWENDPWIPRVTGEGDERRIVGLGTSDMKSGVAVIMHLAEHFNNPAHRLQHLRLAISLTVCEECPAHGKRNGVHRAVENEPGRWAITTEASCDPVSPTLAVGCQAHAVIRIGLRGRSAHSANPDHGLNAIHAAAKICERVDRINKNYKEVQVLEWVKARPATSVTLIKGGSAGNIIPEQCELTISRRVAPGETAADVEREVAEICSNLDGVTATSKFRLDAPACVVDANGALLKCATDASQQLFDRVRYSWNRARTDMVLFKQAGMDVLNIGPGFNGQAHVAGEYCRLVDLPRSANLIAETLARLDKTMA